MGTTCMSVCPKCDRHVRCGERACPFCGASVSSFMRVLEYRVMTRLDRSRALSLGAALSAAGFAVGCFDGGSTPAYGLPCTPMICPPLGGAAGSAGAPISGGSGGTTGGSGGLAGSMPTAGSALVGEGGLANEGGATSQGGEGGVPSMGEGGALGEAGSSGEANSGGQGGSP